MGMSVDLSISSYSAQRNYLLSSTYLLDFIPRTVKPKIIISFLRLVLLIGNDNLLTPVSLFNLILTLNISSFSGVGGST